MLSAKDVQMLQFKREYFKLLRERFTHERPTVRGSEKERNKRIFMRDLNKVGFTKYEEKNVKELITDGNEFQRWFKEFKELDRNDNFDIDEYLCANNPKGGLGCLSNKEKRRQEAKAKNIQRKIQNSGAGVIDPKVMEKERNKTLSYFEKNDRIFGFNIVDDMGSNSLKSYEFEVY